MIQKLLQMIKENPSLEIKFMISNNELCEDFPWTNQFITSVKVCPWIIYGDQIFTDYDDFLEQVVNAWEEYESDEIAKAAYPVEDMQKYIVVFLGA